MSTWTWIPFCSKPFNPRDTHAQGFTGASYDSFEGLVTYEFNKKVNVSFRAEQYHNPNHFINAAPFGEMSYPFAEDISGPPFPIWSAIAGSFNDVTGGMNYKPRKNIFIRPELRYDWQSGNYGVRAFGQNNLIIDSIYYDSPNPAANTYSSQFLAGIDTVINF